MWYKKYLKGVARHLKSLGQGKLHSKVTSIILVSIEWYLRTLVAKLCVLGQESQRFRHHG